MCAKAKADIESFQLRQLSRFITALSEKHWPKKADQDCLDACICLVSALYLIESRKCLMVGDIDSGYIVVPFGTTLRQELVSRCKTTGTVPAAWVRTF